MKLIKILSITFITLLFFIPDLQALDADKILSYWLTQDGDSQVKIFKAKNGKYYGDIRWLEEPYEDDGTPKRDNENSDSELQKR
ncbi:MAG: hypothetical protein SVU94_06060 [Bacteroidota bacterium]|nr:hypothetical protein [Bacteroidota bacterium]